MRYDSGKLLLAVDIAGPFLFGIEGADAAIRGNLDLLGFFLAHVPRVLQADIYAMAALVGAVILIVTRRLGISATLAAIAGGVCCFVLRVVAGYFHWNLPRIANP